MSTVVARKVLSLNTRMVAVPPMSYPMEFCGTAIYGNIYTCNKLITDHKGAVFIMRFCHVKSSRWSPTGLVLHSIFQDKPPSHLIILNTRYSVVVHNIAGFFKGENFMNFTN